MYAALAGFPDAAEQPKYYQMLRNIGSFAHKPAVRLLVAVAEDEDILGGVVYFGDMSQYGSGGIATQVKDASGFRLLGVDPNTRGQGIGRLLTLHCIELAR